MKSILPIFRMIYTSECCQLGTFTREKERIRTKAQSITARRNVAIIKITWKLCQKKVDVEFISVECCNGLFDRIATIVMSSVCVNRTHRRMHTWRDIFLMWAVIYHMCVYFATFIEFIKNVYRECAVLSTMNHLFHFVSSAVKFTVFCIYIYKYRCVFGAAHKWMPRRRPTKRETKRQKSLFESRHLILVSSLRIRIISQHTDT